jgi:thiosulfate/3-mercaptopyruvate sulfurtransferase
VTARSGRHPLPPAETFAATLGRLGIDNDTTVMAYDQQSGAVAARLWWMLHSLGHHRVCVLDGGIAAWIAQGQPLQSGAETVAARRFEARQADYRKLVTTDEVLAALVSGRLPPLVDAREAARFAGEEEPIDAVAGHIPGAVNLPFGGNLDDAGHWKSPAMLAERLAARIPDATSNGWVSMCGSGVTACHLALAADRANFAAPRLYAGSWSEWIRDPARPVSARQQP